MEWISTNKQLPESGEVVVIKVDYTNIYICVARFLDNYSGLFGDYNNVFVVIQHPRFPKEWAFTERYFKMTRIPKSKVKFWMPLPKLPEE